MLNNSSILLCDLGGTHARFARLMKQGTYDNFRKYRLNDFDSFEEIITRYLNDSMLQFDNTRFASARAAVDGRIQYKRHAGDPDYIIDFKALKDHFKWSELKVLNDLEAGTLGLPLLDASQTQTLLPATEKPWNAKRLLISVGTGIGHSGIHNTSVLETPGGHWLPITVTEEHQKLAAFLRDKKDSNFALIMEDFVSGHGLRDIAGFISGNDYNAMSPEIFLQDLQNHPEAVRLFFEFLGLYANTLTAVTGYYGGIYLTGGVIDNLVKHDLTDWNAFEVFYRPNMVQSVNHRLNGSAVQYVLYEELPLLGLTSL